MRAQIVFRGVLIMILHALSYTAIACTTCNRRLQAGIFNENFITNLVLMLLPFIVISLIAGALYRLK